MPSINVGEADFTALAFAAGNAMRSGDAELAQTLDKLARKVNAALTSGNKEVAAWSDAAGMPRASRLRWQDVPSTLEPPA